MVKISISHKCFYIKALTINKNMRKLHAVSAFWRKKLDIIGQGRYNVNNRSCFCAVRDEEPA